jgi:hypothetical protein
MVIFDETHNMLSGTYSDQRRILAQLRYLSNELRVSIICLGIETARDAIVGDPQLARRFGQVELPAWEVNADFRALIATLLRNLPLRGPSVLDITSLQTVIRTTRGNTARIFELFGETLRSPRSGMVTSESPRTQSARGSHLYMTGLQPDEPIMASATTPGSLTRSPPCRR